MADTKISGLGAVTTLADTDLITVVTGTSPTQVNKKITSADLKTFSKGSAQIGSTMYRQKFFGIGGTTGFNPTLTSGCGAIAQLETGTYKNVFDYLPFDSSSTERAYINYMFPSDYTGGNVYSKYLWTHPATTVNFGISFAFTGLSSADNTSLDLNIGTSIFVVDTGGITSNFYLSPLSSAITLAGSPGSQQNMYFRISRVPSEAGDNMMVDAYLLGVLFYYPVA
jgi:hypothetical protein